MLFQSIIIIDNDDDDDNDDVDADEANLQHAVCCSREVQIKLFSMCLPHNE